MNAVLAAFLLWAPLKDASEAEEALRLERRAKEWKEVLPEEVVCPRLYGWLGYVDPRPAEAFRPFTDERAERHILACSASWSGKFFQKVANPAGRRHRADEPLCFDVMRPPKGYEAGVPLPPGVVYEFARLPNPNAEEEAPRWQDAFRGTGVEGGYYLPSDTNRRSLLLYRWKAGDYAFEMQESHYAVLLRVRHKDRLNDLKDGVSRSRVEAVLNDVLSKAILDQGPVGRQFRVPEKVFPGAVLTNATTELFGCPFINDWRKSVLVFLTQEDLGLILFKENWTPSRQQYRMGDFGEKDGFPAGILEKDGKTPVRRMK